MHIADVVERGCNTPLVADFLPYLQALVVVFKCSVIFSFIEVHNTDVVEGVCNTLLVANPLSYLQTPLVVLEGSIVFSYVQMHIADGVEGKRFLLALLTSY